MGDWKLVHNGQVPANATAYDGPDGLVVPEVWGQAE